jgi:putative pyruvate formate lyase activating enzyme
VFCQNYELSHSAKGKVYTPDALEEAMLSLVDAGAYNINLVTPTHYVPYILPVLERVKPKISVPIVYNCGGYESVETLRTLEGIVDVYLPDFKYFSSEISEKYSRAADYFTVACAALGEMYRQVGAACFGADGMMEKGMIVRHLVLPGNRKDSIQVLRALAELLPVEDIKLSLMRQYTPDFALGCEYTELHRRLTEFEYTSVLRVAEELGFDGYFQGKDSADKKFTPDFEV